MRSTPPCVASMEFQCFLSSSPFDIDIRCAKDENIFIHDIRYLFGFRIEDAFSEPASKRLTPTQQVFLIRNTTILSLTSILLFSATIQVCACATCTTVSDHRHWWTLWNLSFQCVIILLFLEFFRGLKWILADYWTVALLGSTT